MKKLLNLCVLFLLATATHAQNTTGSVKGIVTTSDNKPAPYVSVLLKGTKKGAMTAEDGSFLVKNIAPGSYDLQISLQGYEPLVRTVVIEAGKTAGVSLQLTISQQQLDEVVVSMTRNRFANRSSNDVGKMPLKNLENPQVYNTITKDLTRQQLAFSVDDAIANAAGISHLWDATNRSGSGGTVFTSRGFATQPMARNGIYGNVNASIDVANIERIEVIKGPSATLFGNVVSSYGGLINRVTKKPYNYTGGEIDYTGGSYNYNRVSADVNIPLDKAKKLLMRTNMVYRTQNSFQDYGFANSWFVAPAFTYQPDDRLQINFEAEIMKGQNSGGAQIIYFLTPSYASSIVGSALQSMGVDNTTIGAILSAMPKTMKESYGTDRADEIRLDYKRSYLSNDLVNVVNTANFFGEVKYKISNQWTAQTLLSKSGSNTDGVLPYFYLLPNSIPAFIASLPSGTPSFGTPGHDLMARMVWKNVGNENITQIQQNFIGDFNIGKFRNRLVAGLDFFSYNARINYDRYTGNLMGFPFADAFDTVRTSGYVPNYYHLNKGKVDSAYAAGSPANIYYNNNQRTYSAFIHDVFNITDGLLVTAGLRVDHFVDKGTYDATTGDYLNDYEQTQLAPKFGIIYQPVVDKLSLFANYQSGFTNKTGVDAEGKSFKPEQAFQWEGGVKMNLLNNRLSGSLSYYDIRVKDIVRASVNDPLFNVQDGEQESKGVEFEISALPFNGLNLTAGYGYNNSKLVKSDPDVEGLRPVATGPEHTVNFWAAYRFTGTALKNFTIGAGGNYASEAFAINSKMDGSFILPAYTLINGLVSYEHPRYRLAVKVNNIGNKKYWIGWTTMNPQMSREVLASIAFKF